MLLESMSQWEWEDKDEPIEIIEAVGNGRKNTSERFVILSIKV